MCVARRRKRALLQLSQFTSVQYPKGLMCKDVGRYVNSGAHILMCSPSTLVERCLTDLPKTKGRGGGELPPPPPPPLLSPFRRPWVHESYKIALTMSLLSHATAPLHNTCNEKKKKSCMCCSRFFSVDFWSNFYLQNTWVRLAQVFLGHCVLKWSFTQTFPRDQDATLKYPKSKRCLEKAKTTKSL